MLAHLGHLRVPLLADRRLQADAEIALVFVGVRHHFRARALEQLDRLRLREPAAEVLRPLRILARRGCRTRERIERGDMRRMLLQAADLEVCRLAVFPVHRHRAVHDRRGDDDIAGFVDAEFAVRVVDPRRADECRRPPVAVPGREVLRNGRIERQVRRVRRVRWVRRVRCGAQVPRVQQVRCGAGVLWVQRVHLHPTHLAPHLSHLTHPPHLTHPTHLTHLPSRASSSRPSGPRRYDIDQRVLKRMPASSCTLCKRNVRFSRLDSILSVVARLKPRPASAFAPSRPSSRRALSRSVCRRPSIQVPQLASAL